MRYLWQARRKEVGLMEKDVVERPLSIVTQHLPGNMERRLTRAELNVSRFPGLSAALDTRPPAVTSMERRSCRPLAHVFTARDSFGVSPAF
uniref:Uncharacterized protein n=1 Tax=Ascaris lumbricoides TaxID=6252 RepID=A0A0M3IMK5_ASCLU